MRLAATATSLTLGLILSLATALPSARADDYYSFRDTSFVVTSTQVSAREVTVTGLGTARVSVTVKTRDVPAPIGPTGEVTMPEPATPRSTLQLVERRDYAEGQVVTLGRVAGDGPLNTWRGVVPVTGPSRTLTFRALRRCSDVIDCRFLHDHDLAPITVRAVQTPVIHFDRTPTVDLSVRSYVVSGRVLTSSGTSFGRRLTVVVGRGQECWVSALPGSTTIAGRGVRTGIDGRFRVVLDNLPDLAGAGAPVAQTHCARMGSGVTEPARGVVLLTSLERAMPWRARLPVTAPTTIRRGRPATVRSSAPLPTSADIRLERLHGRTAWRTVRLSSSVSASGRISVRTIPDALGRHLYRLRSSDSQAMSQQFVMVTVR